MSCDRSFDVSVLIDGELAADATPAVVEHLLGCAECRELFRRGRALDAALLLAAAEEAEPLAPAPPEVWRRIGAAVASEARALRAKPAAPRRLRPRAWAVPLVASVLLLLGVAVGWLLAPRGGAVTAALAGADGPAARFATAAVRGPAAGARVGEAGAMDEERFVAIARELLAAERRYRDAMAGVLVVADSLEPREGSTAESTWREEELRELVPASPRRGAQLY